MTTRLRYTTVNGLLTVDGLVSTTLNDTLRVVITPATLSAEVLNSANEVVTTVQSTTLPLLKKVVKTTLQTLGVVFLNEVRSRTTTNEQAA